MALGNTFWITLFMYKTQIHTAIRIKIIQINFLYQDCLTLRDSTLKLLVWVGKMRNATTVTSEPGKSVVNSLVRIRI